MAPLGQIIKACYAEAERIGKKPSPSGFITLPECPYCGSIRKAGLKANGVFKCFVCGKDVRSYDDWQDLAARMAAPMQYTTSKSEQRQPIIKKQLVWQRDPMRWHSRYTNDRNAVIEAWQAYKPLSEASIMRAQLGLGIMPPTDNQSNYTLGCNHQRLIYANIENADKQATAFRGRRIGCTCTAKWITVKGSDAWLWGSYHMLRLAAGRWVFIVENPIDALLVMQAMPDVIAIAGTAGAGTFPWVKLVASANPKGALVWLDNDLIGNPTPRTRELLIREWIANMRKRGHEPTPDMIAHQRTKAMAPKLVTQFQALHVKSKAWEWAEGTTPRMDAGQYLIDKGNL